MNCPICGSTQHTGSCPVTATAKQEIGLVGSALPAIFTQNLQDLYGSVLGSDDD